MLVGQSQPMENVIESSKESEEQGLKGLINYTDSESTPESDKQRKEEEEKRKQEEEEARIAEEKKEEEARIEKEKKEAKERREQERKREEERELNRKREEEKRKEEERKRAEEKKINDQKLAEQQMLEEENRKEEQRKRLEEKKRELERKKEEHRKREEQKRREEERQKEEEERREREIAERRTKRRQEKRPVLAEEEEEESEEESSEDDDSNDENEEPDDSDATASDEEMEEPMLLKRKIPVKSNSRKKKVKSSHSKELRTPFATFSCREAFDHYAQIASKRALPDKGFSPESLQEFPLLQATITKLGWERFCEVPSGYNLSLVREFYAEAAVTEGTTVRLRGTDVSYSPAVIDTIFGVHAPVPSLYTRLLNEATDDDAQRILAALVQPGKTWKNALIRNIESRDLAPHISIWFYFLRHTLQPTTHDSSINFDRLIILYCIMYGKRISVGEVIAKSIGHCAEKISGKCWHPSLIHTLITKANVKTFPTDEVTCGKAVIKGDTVRRVTRNAEEAIRKSQAAVKPQGSKQSAKAAAIISKAAALATQKQSTPSRVPRSDVPPPAQEDLNTNSFLYLTKQLERNQETLLKKLQERDTMWLSVMAKHKKEMEEKLEKSEQKVLACLKEQDKAMLQMRKLTALHRNYQMKREGVMEMEWALNHPDDYESIGRYPPELLKEAAEFLQQAEKPPTPPE